MSVNSSVSIDIVNRVGLIMSMELTVAELHTAHYKLVRDLEDELATVEAKIFTLKGQAMSIRNRLQYLDFEPIVPDPQMK